MAALARLAACPVARLGARFVAPGGRDVLDSPTPQTVTVVTVPEGASCTVEWGGASLGAVSPTPGLSTLGCVSGDIAVACTRDGHGPACVTASAMTTRTTDALSTPGDPVATARGSVAPSSGAAYSYPPPIAADLDPAPAGAEPRR